MSGASATVGRSATQLGPSTDLQSPFCPVESGQGDNGGVEIRAVVARVNMQLAETSFDGLQQAMQLTRAGHVV